MAKRGEDREGRWRVYIGGRLRGVERILAYCLELALVISFERSSPYLYLRTC
jgi:hypothetical protein